MFETGSAEEVCCWDEQAVNEAVPVVEVFICLLARMIIESPGAILVTIE